MLELRQFGARLGARQVLEGIDLRIGPGECVGLLGPNGAGKTTLLRAAQGLIPASGYASLAALPAAGRARAVAFVPQGREIAWPMPVAAVVALGRIPHTGAARAEDRAAVERAIARLGLEAYRDRPATALSGGEQARVLIARALAQETPLLIADEPTAGLDPAQQLAVMGLFAELAREGRSVLVSLHDLGLAARFCTRLVVLHGGRIVADGAPRAVLTPELLSGVFGIRAHLGITPEGVIFQPLERVRP